MKAVVSIIYDNIQTLCDKKGLSVSELAENAGLPSGSLSNWRQERTWMRQLPAVANELSVTIDELFRPKDSKTDNDPLIRVFSALSNMDIDNEKAGLIIEIAKLLTKKTD